MVLMLRLQIQPVAKKMKNTSNLDEYMTVFLMAFNRQSGYNEIKQMGTGSAQMQGCQTDGNHFSISITKWKVKKEQCAVYLTNAKQGESCSDYHL